jgi:hypothetical protein
MQRMNEILEKCQEKARIRSQARQAEDASLVQPEQHTPENRLMPKSRRGKLAKKELDQKQLQLQLYCENHSVRQYDVYPGHEFPTVFTRLPLFPPVRRSTAMQEVGKHDWLKLHSRWDGGGVYKAGPALTVYDEDTLIGLIGLRQIALEGSSDVIPICRNAVSPKPHPRDDERICTHTVRCVISQLESEIQGRRPPKGWGGRALEKRRASIKRLAAVTIRFERPFGANQMAGKPIQLLYTEYVDDRHDGSYFIEFHPLVSQWLEKYRTFLNPQLRRKLSPLGKSIHRFLSSQRSNHHYEIELKVLQQAIGSDHEASNFRRSAQPQLAIMKAEGFLIAYEIVGNNRRVPFRLKCQFPNKKD